MNDRPFRTYPCSEKHSCNNTSQCCASGVMLERKKEGKQNSRMCFWCSYVVLNGNSKQSSQCSSQFILNSWKGTPQLAGYSEKMVLVNQYDEILWKWMFCEAPNDIQFPGLIELYLNLTLYIALFTFCTGQGWFQVRECWITSMQVPGKLGWLFFG